MSYAAGPSDGVPRNETKALELWHRAGKLGHAESYYNIGICYYQGNGMEVDKKKARHYYELAAMRGHAGARYNLGCIEGYAGNYDKAAKHFMIAARDGHGNAVKNIKGLYTNGHVTKDYYAKTLRARQEYLDEVKSDKRDKAAAAKTSYKYIE